MARAWMTRLNCPAMKDCHSPPVCESAGERLYPQTNLAVRILVVEDNVDIRGIIAEVLQHSGYLVDTAEDGAAGWKALHAVANTPECHHLLITDCNMPRLSGLGLIKRLRTARIELPVILATATLQEDEFFRHAWLQPGALLRKPYTITELLDTVSEVLFGTCGDRRQFARPQTDQSHFMANF